MISVHLFTFKTPDDESFLLQVLPDFLDKYPDNLGVTIRTEDFSAYWTLTGELEILFAIINWKENFASVWYARDVPEFEPVSVLEMLQQRYASGN